LGEIAVQGGATHAGGPHEFGDVRAFLGGGAQRDPECALKRGGVVVVRCAVALVSIAATIDQIPRDRPGDNGAEVERAA
jgi:hypothetical protein